MTERALGPAQHRLGVSLATVRRIAEEAEVVSLDEAPARAARGVGRPSKAAPFADKVRAWLVEDADVPTHELLRRAAVAT
jgi:hypothetical protein